MPDKRSRNKKAVQVWLPVGLVNQIDAEAERLGQTKTDVVKRALREHFKQDPIPASAAQLDELKTALMQLSLSQTETNQLLREHMNNPVLPANTAENEVEEKKSWWERLFG